MKKSGVPFAQSAPNLAAFALEGKFSAERLCVANRKLGTNWTSGFHDEL
jgi:hypothetical protein